MCDSKVSQQQGDKMSDKLVIGHTYRIECGNGESAIGYLAHSTDQDCYAIVGAINGARTRFPIAVEFYRGQVKHVRDNVIMLKTQDEYEGHVEGQ